MKRVILAALGVALVSGDCYLNSIRGSNNRYDEQNRDRNNGNRLFDSQNNNRGGYNAGRLTFYAGETVPVGWTIQHSSGSYQLSHSEVVIQYACDSLMRDGTTTNTIPDNPTQCANYDCDTDPEYGRHESFTYYQYCKAQERNYGLFTSNQNLAGNRRAAINTRQNPAGTRRGYECPEERDYYPYWRPSPWRDIAVYTNQVDRCDAYQSESQNVKSRKQCAFHEEYWEDYLKGYVKNSQRGSLPSNLTECDVGSKEFQSKRDPTNTTYYDIYSVETISSHGVDAPECLQAQTSRTNHHGLQGGRNYWTYAWDVPDLSDDGTYSLDDYDTCCVLRVRYNITTNDYQAWESDSSINAGLDYRNNTQDNNPNPDNDPAWVTKWEDFNLEYSDIEESFTEGNDAENSRGYVLINNPQVDPFGHEFSDGTDNHRIQLQLAINTNQFGRTFEDRTHCFSIKDRPNSIDSDKDITLVTVQGKRGNIVQVYPATEYFFLPEPAQVSVGDYVHFCWTGSNTNPNNNDGQGKQGTDRSNICPSTQGQYSKDYYSDIDSNVQQSEGDEIYPGSVGDAGNNYPDWVQEPEYIDQLPEWYPYAQQRDVTPSRMAGLDQRVLNALCTSRKTDAGEELFDFGNMEELDDAGTTVCVEPQRVEERGRWNFLCTRNNNFSNRSQKGRMDTMRGGSVQASVSTVGAKVKTSDGEAIVVVKPGQVKDGDTLEFQVTTFSREGKDSTIVYVSGVDGGAFPKDELVDGGTIELWIPFTSKSMHAPTAYRKSSTGSTWKSEGEATVDYSQSTHYAVIDIDDGGYYKVVNYANVWAIVCVVIAACALCTAVSCLMFQKCRK